MAYFSFPVNSSSQHTYTNLGGAFEQADDYGAIEQDEYDDSNFGRMHWRNSHGKKDPIVNFTRSE